MTSGRQNTRLNRIDQAHPLESGRFPGESVNEARAEYSADLSPLGTSIAKTVDYFLNQQHAEGYWVGELEGDTILESEYILLLTYLGEADSEIVQSAARYIAEQQCEHGGWALFPGGPLEISASVKAYWALKIAGYDVDSPMMRKACLAILEAGGAEQVNSFTRYYFALLGIIKYRQCPAIPPQITLLPRWHSFSLQNISAWSRTIIVPLSLLWAYKPSCELPASLQIDELFVRSPRQLSVCNRLPEKIEGFSEKRRFPWAWLFRQLDWTYKIAEGCRITPWRKKGIRVASSWMLERFEGSDGLGAIFPPMVWSLVALKCLGFEDGSEKVEMARRQLDDLIVERESERNETQKAVRIQPCVSPVWDTAIASIALSDAGLARCDTALNEAARWLRSQEIRFAGDWSQSCPDVEPSGWCFEFNNQYYPDIDDTAMVLMTLTRNLPSDLHADWLAEFIPQSGRDEESRLATVVSGRTTGWQEAMDDVTRLQPNLEALRRGVQWLLAMQSSNGGWGAFDADNDQEILTRVPFADHNAMLDPATPDITARVLEALAALGIEPQHPAIERAIPFLTATQEADGSWPGRWGVNYLYGTWQVITGLRAVGIPASDPQIRRGAYWLKSVQQKCGGWGETPLSYEDPSLKGTGPVTPSQTAWALLGLIAAGETDSPEVEQGVRYLLETQSSDGTWEEKEFTGTGFPRVFYLKYHLYAVYFPLIALARYRRNLPIGQ